MSSLKPLSPKGEFVLFNSTARINILSGAVRSSKTVSSVIRLIELALDPTIPIEVRGIIAGRTTRTIERNILSLLRDFLGKKLFSYSSSKNECRIGKRYFDVVGASDERAKEKIQGATYGIGYFDEVALYPKSFWEMALTRFISIENYVILATCNPDSPFHWLKTDYIDKCEEVEKDFYRSEEQDINYFHFTLEDNIYLPKENIEKLKANYSGVFYQRFILGLWVLAEGLIYSVFDNNKNVVDDSDFIDGIDEKNIYYASIDYGAKNPFGIGLFTQHKKTKEFIMLDEFYYSGRKEETVRTNEEYAKNLFDFLKDKNVRKIFCDPSAAAFIATVKKLYPKLGALFVKTDNNVKDGIEATSSAISLNKFKIHKRCKNTKQEFNTYSWNEKKALKTGVEEPLKDNDHMMDLIRYFIFNHVGKADRLAGY